MDLKRQGKGDTKHEDAIEDEDSYKLYDYFENLPITALSFFMKLQLY